jgi:hypothetical protein
MDILNFKGTYTTKFILPLLFKDFTNYNRLFNESFLNAYIADMANKDNDDKIHLLFADYPSLSLQKLLPDPVTEYEHGDGRYVFVYDIPEEYREDYTKFLMGSYSKLSDKAKVKIVSFWQVDTNTLLWCVLYKQGDKIKKFYKDLLSEDLDKFAPSAEWWAPPQIEQEIIGLV